MGFFMLVTYFFKYVPFTAMKLHDLLVSAIMPFFVNPEHICAIERLPRSIFAFPIGEVEIFQPSMS